MNKWNWPRWMSYFDPNYSPDIAPIPGGDIDKEVLLYIGLNYVSSLYYNGWRGDLPDCEDDCIRMSSLMQSYGIKSTGLLSKYATHKNVAAMITEAYAGCSPRSRFHIHISGHTGQSRGPEKDKMSEYVCLYDGPLYDRTISKWLKALPPSETIWTCDTCNAAGLLYTRGPGGRQFKSEPPVIAPDVATDIQASVIMIAGCDEGFSSISTGKGGMLTNSLIRADLSKVSPVDWFGETMAGMNVSRQKPIYQERGPVSDDFRNGPVIKWVKK